MRKVLQIITFILILYTLYHVVNGMVAFPGNTHLDDLYQKSLNYQNHRENYLTSLLETLIPFGLKLLLKELENVIAKLQSEIELEVLDREATYDVIFIGTS